MRKVQKVVKQGIMVCAFVLLVSCLKANIIHAQESYTKEIEVNCYDTKSESELNDYFLEQLSLDDYYGRDRNDIIITSVKVLRAEYEVDFVYKDGDVYYSEYYQEYIYDDYEDSMEVTIDDPTNYSNDQLQQKLLEQIATEMEMSQSDITITEILPDKCIYLVTYQLYSESDEYKKSVAEFMGAPKTTKDSKAELSKVSLYIQGCRIPYLLEDNGEYYIPSIDLYYVDKEIEDIVKKNPKKSFYNLDWKTSVKVGTVIGTIKKEKEGESYIINGAYYRKLSDVLPDWRKLMTYDSSTKTFIYGEGPDANEKRLNKDVIYEFTMKATKGCKTMKEKTIALHDAIILRCHYDNKKYSYNSKLIKEYQMIYNQNYALHMLQDKKGVCENYARLFKECCDRLFIPCELVTGYTSDLHMWNRVTIGSKSYHIDLTYADYIGNKYKKSSDISRQFCLKSAYSFMGHHYWYDSDYKSYNFSKKWKNIDRNNIKTTEQLRKAVIYASYISMNKKNKSYKFKITGNNVDISCAVFIVHNGFLWSGVSVSYKDHILTVTYNISRSGDL